MFRSRFGQWCTLANASTSIDLLVKLAAIPAVLVALGLILRPELVHEARAELAVDRAAVEKTYAAADRALPESVIDAAGVVTWAPRYVPGAPHAPGDPEREAYLFDTGLLPEGYRDAAQMCVANEEALRPLLLSRMEEIDVSFSEACITSPLT